MTVDSFKYLPRSIAAYYQTLVVQKADPIPWTPLAKPLSECRVAAVTTAGIYVARYDLATLVPDVVAPQGLTIGPTSSSGDAPTAWPAYLSL